MAGIIKSPSFDAQARLLLANAAAQPIKTDAGSGRAIAALDGLSSEAMLQTAQQKNTELEATIEQLQAKVEQLEKTNTLQDYAQGYEEGLKSGIAATKEELQSEIESVVSIIENIHQQGQVYLRQLEQVNVESIFAAVIKIIGKTAENSESVRQLLHEQLKRLAAQNKIIVRLALQDYQLLCGHGETAESNLRSENLQFVADDHIQYGGCIIESDGGGLDARLEIQMQQFKNMMLDVYARRQAGEL